MNHRGNNDDNFDHGNNEDDGDGADNLKQTIIVWMMRRKNEKETSTAVG